MELLKVYDAEIGDLELVNSALKLKTVSGRHGCTFITWQFTHTHAHFRTYFSLGDSAPTQLPNKSVWGAPYLLFGMA